MNVAHSVTGNVGVVASLVMRANKVEANLACPKSAVKSARASWDRSGVVLHIFHAHIFHDFSCFFFPTHFFFTHDLSYFWDELHHPPPPGEISHSSSDNNPFILEDTLRVDANVSEADNQKENMCRALIKAGKIPALPQLNYSCITPVAKPIEGQSYQSPHFTVSLSSPCSSLYNVIEDVVSFVRPLGMGKTSRSVDRSRPWPAVPTHHFWWRVR